MNCFSLKFFSLLYGSYPSVLGQRTFHSATLLINILMAIFFNWLMFCYSVAYFDSYSVNVLPQCCQFWPVIQSNVLPQWCQLWPVIQSMFCHSGANFDQLFKSMLCHSVWNFDLWPRRSFPAPGWPVVPVPAGCLQHCARAGTWVCTAVRHGLRYVLRKMMLFPVPKFSNIFSPSIIFSLFFLLLFIYYSLNFNVHVLFLLCYVFKFTRSLSYFPPNDINWFPSPNMRIRPPHC